MKRLDGLLGIVVAPVADDDQLEFADGLMQDRLDRGLDVLAPTVGGQDDREGVVGKLGGLDARTSALRLLARRLVQATLTGGTLERAAVCVTVVRRRRLA